MSTTEIARTYPAGQAAMYPPVRPNTTDQIQARSDASVAAQTTAQPANISQLVTALHAAGCTVPRRDEYLALLRTPRPRPLPVPLNVLDLTPEAYAKDVTEYAVQEAGRIVADKRYDALRRQLDQEMAAVLAAHADEFLDHLRPAFDLAAAEARAVVKFGITPTENAERVIARGGAAAERWISFKSGSQSVATLARIAGIRAGLAQATGAGEGPGADHSIGVLSTFIPEALKDRPGEERHVKWLRMAEHLELVPFADLGQDDILRAQGENPEELRSNRAYIASLTAAGDDIAAELTGTGVVTSSGDDPNDPHK